MSTEPLPPWPDVPPAFIAPRNALEGALVTETRLKHYENDRAEAAIARLRVAVEALKEVGQYIEVLPGTIRADFFDGCPDVVEALTAIGNVP